MTSAAPEGVSPDDQDAVETVHEVSPLDYIARVGVLLVVVVVGAQAIVNLHVLYADGAYQFWFHLVNGGFWIYDPARSFAQVLTQWPIVLALAAGTTDPSRLALIHGIGIVGVPIAAWICALALLIRQPWFWLMCLIFSVVYLNSGFIAVGEFNVAYALVAVAAAVIVRRNLGWAQLLLLLGIAVVLVRSYEGVVYLAPLLALALAFRVFSTRHGLPRPGGLKIFAVVAILVAYGVGAVMSAITILVPRDPGNRAGAADLISPLQLDHQLVASVAAVAGLLVLLVLPRTARWVAGSVVIVGVLVVMGNPSNWAAPWLHYAARTVTGLVLAILLVFFFALAMSRNRRTSPSVSPAIWIGAATLFLVQVVPFSLHSASFGRWLAVVESTVVQAQGPVRQDDTALLDSATSLYVWPWTNPFLSRIFQDSPDGGILLNPGQDSAEDAVLPGPVPPQYIRVDDSVLIN